MHQTSNMDRSLGHRRGKIERQLEELRQRAEREGEQSGHQRGFEEGRAEGFEKGYEDGLKQGLVEAPSVIRSLNQIGDSVHVAIAQWYVDAVQNLAELSVAVAQKIVQQELATNEDAVVNMTARALSDFRQATQIRIFSNPYQCDILNKHRGRLNSVLNGLTEIEIIEDETIEGGCRIESDSGGVDATLERQLSIIHNAIRGAA